MKYFKLFELENNVQLLIIKDYYEEDFSPCMTICFFIQGFKVNLTIGFKTNSTRDKAFSTFTKKKGLEIYDSVAEEYFNEEQNKQLNK